MYGTGAGVWSSTNIQSATGSSGQGVTWTFTDSGLEETVPLFMMPAVKGAFLGALGDLGGMRNTNLDAYSSTGEYTNPIQSNVNGIDFAENNTNIVVRVGNSGTAASDVATPATTVRPGTPATATVPGYSGPEPDAVGRRLGRWDPIHRRRRTRATAAPPTPPTAAPAGRPAADCLRARCWRPTG